MLPSLPAYRLLVSHQDQVTTLPDNAEHLAGSEFCPYGMYQIGNNILAIQGHPEFSKDYAETLMQYRRNRLGEPTFRQGIISLKKTTDELTIAQWMIQFIATQKIGAT